MGSVTKRGSVLNLLLDEVNTRTRKVIPEAEPQIWNTTQLQLPSGQTSRLTSLERRR